ncbi:MAG: ATP-binding cassette domain-containing protein, partial [Acholeplasmataceae bacterium]|nr:ATP-binding cassette domain-containing protein [Acholeplasmataceae bacterium]
MIKYENIDVTFGKFNILKDVSFTLKKGEMLHIIGPNGSGKTTLVKMLVGLLEPTSGKIENHATQMGYLPQKLNTKLNLPMTVREVIYSGIKNQKLKPSKAD